MTQAEGESDPRPVHEGFVEGKLALGEVFLCVITSLRSHRSPTTKLHILSIRQHFSLSPRLSGLFGGRRKLVPQYKSGLCKPLLRYIASV